MAADGGGWPPPPAASDEAAATARPGRQAATPTATPTATQAAAAAGDTPAWGGPPVRSEPRRGNGARLALVLGILVAAVVGLGLVGMLTTVSGGGFDSDEVVSEEFVDEGPERVVPDPGTPMVVGDVRDGDVASREAWSVDLSVAEAGPVRIDVRGAAGFDPVATLYRGDEVLDRDDDRGSPRADELGGNFLDPLLEMDLDAGDYRLEVTGFGSSAGSFEVRVEQP